MQGMNFAPKVTILWNVLRAHKQLQNGFHLEGVMEGETKRRTSGAQKTTLLPYYWLSKVVVRWDQSFLVQEDPLACWAEQISLPHLNLFLRCQESLISASFSQWVHTWEEARHYGHWLTVFIGKDFHKDLRRPVIMFLFSIGSCNNGRREYLINHPCQSRKANVVIESAWGLSEELIFRTIPWVQNPSGWIKTKFVQSNIFRRLNDH